MDIDQILQRRPNEWYVGRAMLIPRDYARGMGIPAGYYRVDSMMPNGDWYLLPLDSRPENEPIYISDGSRDLKADPWTVVPPWWEFALWFTAYVVCLITAVSVSADTEGVALVFWGLCLSPWLAGPFFTWYVNVEPVRGTKAALALLGAQAAMAVKQHHDRQEMARINQTLAVVQDRVQANAVASIPALPTTPVIKQPVNYSVNQAPNVSPAYDSPRDHLRALYADRPWS